MGKNKRTDDSIRSRKKARTEKQQQEETPDESDISDTDKFSDDEEGGFRIDDIYIPPPLPATCSYESRGPRLIIMKIVNVNFKSYAGRVVVGPFDKSFSGIIGPNGSGKSNVIDSMLFVFGYRATKIRSKKVSVLIHKSEQHQNVSSCKVEVHFAQIIDGENGTYEKIPNSEIVISRTAFQNSSSFYELNNRKVQFKEVAMTLREHGIDLIHNRFLILQGEVEKIALMKPIAQNPHESGMLEYLEDIIGTTRYKEPLEKLEARVESLNQDRQDKIKLLQIVQDERNALRGPVEETVNFLKGENKITQLYNKKFQLILHQTNADISKTQEKKTTHVKKQQEIEKNLQEIQNKKGTEKTEIDSVNKTLQKMTKKYEEFNAIRQNAEKKKTGLTEELKQLKKTQKKTTENLKSEEEKLKGLLEVPEENQAEIEKLTKREAELDERRKKEEAVLQKVMSNIQKETKTFQEEKEKLQAEQLKIKKKHDEMRSAFELAKSERDIYVSTEQAEKNKLEQFVTKYQDIKETLIQKKNELSSLQKELPQKEKTLKKAEEDLREIRGKDTSITQDLRNFQSQLEDKKSSMSANHSNDRVKNFIMKLKAEGKVPGIFGRLGDLGAIDKKYDVAISTACPGLDHFVVDTSDHIGQIIKALKENNAGRATFIALDKIDELYRRRNANFKGPENTPALFDFVRVQDERVRPAFYFVIRQTLVVDTIEQAKRVGYDYGARYRVVTLDGSVIETTGTMSGGGNQKIRGKMGSSVTVSTDPNTAEEVVKLERRVSALEVELQRFREKERECEEIISTLEPEIRAMKANINKLTIAIQGLTKQEPELKTQIENQKKKVAECAPNENRLCELSKKVQDTEKGARKAEQEANAIEEKVLAVHNKIMEITGGKTKEAQKRLDDITEERDKTRNNITKLQVAIKSAERNTKKTKERIENMRTELKEKEERTAEIETEMDTVKEDCELSSERANELKTQMEEKQQRLEKLQEEYKNFLGDVNQLKAEKLRVEQEIEEVNKELQNLEKKVPAAKHELKKLTLNEIPTFQEPSDDEGQNVEEPEETNRPVENANDPNVLAVYDAETMATWRSEDIDAQIANEKEHLKEFNPNMNTLNDFKRKTIQYIERNNELKEITKRRNTCREGLKTVSGNRNKEFMNGFTAISGKLKEIYQQLAPGGDAELDLYDSMNPFSEGINFCVRPPKKSWKNITNLSGGEKTLSSLALVFALHYYRPTPLYVMDEIDAALDFKNVLIVARYIKDRTKNAQFIVISLRTQMFEVANKLTGIYKTFNCTKSVTMCPAELCRDNLSTSSARISQEYQAPSTSMARISPEHQAPSGSGGMSPERNSDMPSTNSRGISPERHMPPPHQTLVPPEEQRKRKTKQRFSNDLAQSNEEYNSDKENTDDTDMSEIDSNESDVDKLEKIRRNAVIKHTNPAEIESSKETINFSDVDRDSNESEILRAAEIRENQRDTRRSSRSSHESSQERDLKTVLERYQNNRPSRNA